jgi:hypothetical protein
MKTAVTQARAVLSVIRRRPMYTLAISVPLLAMSVFAGTTVTSAHPEPTLAVSQAELNAAPAPLVRTFADGLTGPRVKTYKRPRRIPEPWNIDGCDHDYGTASQCVPWHVPASSGERACAWLKSNGFGPLKVHGTNRQHLPENEHGYVCAGAGR